jgi:hypothetical protein
MTTYAQMWTEILARIAEMEREALFSLVGTVVDSKPYFPYKGQEAFPFWINRLATATYTNEGYGMDNLHITRQISMRLVVGNITEGYDGELQTAFNEFVGAFVPYISQKANAYLKTATYPTNMQYLEQELRLVSDTGVIIFSNNGVGTMQMGVEFVVELELTIKV